MRTIETTIYTFDELSDDAKYRASDAVNGEHFWRAESLEGLEAFARYFGVRVTSWEYDAGYTYNIETDAENCHFRGLTLAKARAMPEYLTGYCLDWTLREVFLREFEKSGDALGSFKLAMNEGIKETAKDWECQCSEDATAEHCEANDYEFRENGELV